VSLARWTGFAAIVAAHEIESRYVRMLQPVGISVRDFVVLSEIAHRRGISQQGLAQRLGLSRSRISEQLMVLDQIGLVEREINPLDLRRRKLWLSPGGAHLLEEAREQITHADDGWTARLDRDERPAFRAMLGRLPPNHQVRWGTGPTATSAGRP
jgi:DNA-binding MarR family transcriptional regulator